MQTDYFRPIVRFDNPKPADARLVAGGPGWYSHAARHRRGGPITEIPRAAVPEEWRARIEAPRSDIAGISLNGPRIMGILNVTPDSFSDGGQHKVASSALNHALQMAGAGADIIDIGGESTRPGAPEVPEEAEIARVEPVVRALRHELAVPMSIDTRKASVARAAVEAGASLVNDVSGFTFDAALAPFCAENALPVCIMHTQGTPETMHIDPQYDDVLLDTFDFLMDQVALAERLGISRARILVDPGIGFGKTLQHNLTLLRHLSLLHATGCGILLGASRKGFIGKISGASPASARMPGSVAVALAGASQGAQVIRVHDVAETAQALALWRALHIGFKE